MATVPETSAAMRAVVDQTIAHADGALREYIAAVLENNPGVDAPALFEAIGEMLVWYGVSSTDDAALALCGKLVAALHLAALAPEVSPERVAARAAAREGGWQRATQSTLKTKAVAAGAFVKARYAGDGAWYLATVDARTPDGALVVTYLGYGTSECVLARDVKVPGPALQQRVDARAKALAADKAAGANAPKQWREADEAMFWAELEAADDGPEDGDDADVDGALALPEPVRISDFGLKNGADDDLDDDSAAVAAAGAKRDADSAEALSKRDQRELAKERRKAELARAREEKRAIREAELKEEAIRTYLSNLSLGKSRAVDIHVNAFNMTSPDGSRELLQNATFTLAQGRVYGLIGPNGVGKTTLLKCFAHYEIPGFPSHIRVVHVEQESRGDGWSALQSVLRADVEREVLLHEEARLRGILEQQGDESTAAAASGEPALTVGVSADEADNTAEEARWRELTSLMMGAGGEADPIARLEQVHQQMQNIDAFGAEARAAEILSGLQFTPERMRVPTRSLSGGWRMRVSLACALFAQPDLLLLDEPTNHLDFPAVLWLEQYLNKYPKTVVVISHDRMFLNNTITDVLHFHKKLLTTYKGDYSTFEKVRTEQIRQQKRAFEAQQERVAHVQEFIDKFRVSASRSALVQSRIKALKKMDKVEDVEDEAVFSMTFPAPADPLGQAAIELNDVSFSYTGAAPWLLANVTCNVGSDSRVGVLGANGIGKTTLINILVGKLEASHGRVTRNGNARVATFAQHHMDKLKPQLSALDFFLDLYPSTHPQVVRRHLGSFGVLGPLQTQLIGSMSGGQKSRVAFAALMWERPHVIIMDEPTNHLDLETVDALIGAVNGYGGGVLVVSHDQHFLSSVCKQFWAVSDGAVKAFDDFLDAKKFSYAKVARV